MPSTLRELQENFQAYVLNQENHVLQSLSAEQNNAVERINIYKRGYVLRLLEILEKDFPYLKKIMTEETFEKFGEEYIELYPSTHFSVCVFSRHYSQFLMETKNQPLWSEIASFEWALSCALDAADDSQIGMESLGTVAGESWPFIQFYFHPSVTLHKFHFNAPQITYAHMQEQETIPELIHNEESQNWVIWRFEKTPYFESVTPHQLWMIEALKQEKTFSEICEGLCQWLPEEEVALFAAGSLRNWIEKGLFSSFKISEAAIA